MSKFKIGQKVRIVNKPYMLFGCCSKVYREYWKIGDEFIINCIDRSGDLIADIIKNGEHFINHSCVELVEEPHYKKYLGKKYAVHCKTQEEWDRVRKILCYNLISIDSWMMNEEQSCIDCFQQRYTCVGNFKQEGYTIISFKEFMGVEEKYLGKDVGSEDGACTVRCHITSDNKIIVDEIINKPNIIKTTMNKIQKALRTKEQKAFEHFGFGTPEVLNEEGREAYTDYIYETGDVTKKGFQEKVVELWQEETKK